MCDGPATRAEGTEPGLRPRSSSARCSQCCWRGRRLTRLEDCLAGCISAGAESRAREPPSDLRIAGLKEPRGKKRFAAQLERTVVDVRGLGQTAAHRDRNLDHSPTGSMTSLGRRWMARRWAAAGASGWRLPCSQFFNVASAIRKTAANSSCDISSAPDGLHVRKLYRRNAHLLALGVLRRLFQALDQLFSELSHINLTFARL